MAKILNIEIDTAQLRVAETDSRGLRIYRCFTLPVPQGAVDDGQIRDTKTLGTLLKKELEARNINNKKVFFVAGSSRIASREVRIPFVKKDRIQSIIQENATDRYFRLCVILQHYRYRNNRAETGRRTETVSSDGVRCTDIYFDGVP